MAEKNGESKAKQDLKKVEVLVIKSVAASFRRLGIVFTREAQHLDAAALSDEQKAALVADPNLTVTTATVAVAAPGTPASPVVTPVEAPAAPADASGAK